MRVALGSICKLLLREFNIGIYSHVINIGGVEGAINYYNGLNLDDLNLADNSELRVVDKESEKKMIDKIEEAKEEGNSLGGTIEIIGRNIPVGLGSHINWEKKTRWKTSCCLNGDTGNKGSGNWPWNYGC